MYYYKLQNKEYFPHELYDYIILNYRNRNGYPRL